MSLLSKDRQRKQDSYELRCIEGQLFLPCSYLSIALHYFKCARSSLKALCQEMLTRVGGQLVQSCNPLENNCFSEVAIQLYPSSTSVSHVDPGRKWISRLKH